MGDGEIQGCYVEYVEELSFEASGYSTAETAPCDPAPPYVSPTDISSSLGGLKAGTRYRYRLVATNSVGKSTSMEASFTTLDLPEVTTEPATNAAATTTTLNGRVDPAGAPPIGECEFEYVDESEYSATGYRYAKTAPCAPATPYLDSTEVSAAVTGLQPSTDYRYRVAATDSNGRSVGADSTFATLPEGEPSKVKRKPHRVAKAGSVRCSLRACSRSLEGSTRLQSWTSPRFPSRYGWLFSVYRRGHSLPNTNSKGGCSGTFAGHGLVAILNGCQGRFKLIYLGSGPFRIRWRIFRIASARIERTGDLNPALTRHPWSELPLTRTAPRRDFGVARCPRVKFAPGSAALFAAALGVVL